VAASTFAFQSLSMAITGRTDGNRDIVSYSDFLFRIALVRASGLETGMKRSNAKLALMHGSNKTVPMSQFHDYMALLCQQVKLYETLSMGAYSKDIPTNP